jgi:hypothetical protein
VSFSGDPGIQDSSNVSSPLNPRNWTVTPDEAAATVRLVQTVEVVTAETLALFTAEWPQLALLTMPVLLVWFDGVLDAGERYHLELSTPGTVETGCDCAEVVGLTLRRDSRQTDGRDGSEIRDIANPFLERDALRLPGTLSTYQLDDTGDFGLDKSEESGLRKRIFRRVSTAAAGFFHLPGYGAAPKLKGLLTADAAERIASRLKAQVLQEPDVVEASVSVTQVQGTPNMLACSIRVTAAGGDSVSLVVPIALP